MLELAFIQKFTRQAKGSDHIDGLNLRVRDLTCSPYIMLSIEEKVLLRFLFSHLSAGIPHT